MPFAVCCVCRELKWWPAICDQFTFFACLLCFFCCGLTYTRNIQTQESFSSIYFKSDTLSPKDEKRQQSKFRIFVISGKMITSNKLNRHRLTVASSMENIIIFIYCFTSPTIDKLFIYPQLVTESKSDDVSRATFFSHRSHDVGSVLCRLSNQTAPSHADDEEDSLQFGGAHTHNFISSAILLYYFVFFVWFSPSLTQARECN